MMLPEGYAAPPATVDRVRDGVNDIERHGESDERQNPKNVSNPFHCW